MKPLNGISITFAPNVRAAATARGVTLSSEEMATMETVLTSLARIDDENQLRFVVGDKIATLDDALDVYLPGTSTTRKPTPAPLVGNATARALAANAATRDGQSTARLTEAQDLIDEHGSPWDPRTISRTRQALVRNLNPQLAARLIQQAGVRA